MAKAKPASKNVSLGNSPIASLGSKATTQSATASSNNLKPHPNFTGQYWLERFITNDESEQSKMMIVRQAAKVLDVSMIKKNLDDMVELASKIDQKEGFTKENGNLNKGPTYKTAANMRTVLLRCFGAIRFAEDELKKQGYSDKTGFHSAYNMSRVALDKKVIKWDGTKAETKEDREARVMMKREEQALAKIKKAMPRQPNQSLVEYESACLKLVTKQLEQDKLEEETKVIDKQVESALTLGPDMAKAIAESILASIKAQEEAQQEAKSKKSNKKHDEELV